MLSGKLKDILSFSKRERRGIYVLSVIIVLLIVLRIWAPYEKKNQEVYDFSEYEAEINRFKTGISQKSKNTEKKKTSNKEFNFNSELHKFNPNKISYQKLIKIGFSENLANNLIKYRNAGGKFYAKKDLLKLYGMDKSFFQRLKPFIIVEEKKETSDKEKSREVFKFNPQKISKDSILLLGFQDDVAQRWVKFRNAGKNIDEISDLRKIYGINQELLSSLEKFINFSTNETENAEAKIQAIELNSINIEELEKVKQIPAWLADRIISYRDLLGGFYDKKQLAEVYGMKENVYSFLLNNSDLNKDSIKTINLNNTKFKELLKHPYLEIKDVKKITQFTNFSDSVTAVDELKTNHILKDSVFNKMKFYFSVD